MYLATTQEKGPRTPLKADEHLQGASHSQATQPCHSPEHSMQVAVSAGSELVQPEIDEERNATVVCEISPQDIADIPTTQLYTTKAAVMIDKIM